MTCCGDPTVSGVWSAKSSRDGPCPYTGASSKYGRNSHTAAREAHRTRMGTPKPTAVGLDVPVVYAEGIRDNSTLGRDPPSGARRCCFDLLHSPKREDSSPKAEVHERSTADAMSPLRQALPRRS